MYKDFHELSIWKDGYTLLMEIYTVSTVFHSDDRFGLTTQMRRSANSVIANIAESHGRFSFQDKIRVLYITRGEILETRSHIAVAYGRRYITKEQFKKINAGYINLTKQLNLYISSLQKQKHQSK